MKYRELLTQKVGESVASIMPITGIVLLLSITFAPLRTEDVVSFLFGSFLLVIGMSFFNVGAEMSMIPMGEGIGVQLSKAKKKTGPLLICFILGVIITIAEPDLQVLAEQVPMIPNTVLVFSVAIGVGFFFLLARLRELLHIPVSAILIISYSLVFLVAIFAPNSFIPLSFDSGGVTTGPISVPFILSVGIGMASLRSDKNSKGDSFGLTAVCSIGSVLSVLILGLIYHPNQIPYTSSHTTHVEYTKEVAVGFIRELPKYAFDVMWALIPILLIFILFQIYTKRFHKHQLYRILLGYFYTFIGLVSFLTGANLGFMTIGRNIGIAIVTNCSAFFLVPIGMVIGFFIIRAEPAVQILTKQVEDVTNGSISQKDLTFALAVGMAIAVGLSMIRIIFQIPILYFLVPTYLISLVMTFFVSQLFTGIAFDAGGVASGPMTTTFLLPFAVGACEALGGNILLDAFGIVAFVAMTPLFTIQFLGVRDRLKKTRLQKKYMMQFEKYEDTILFFD